MKSWRLRLFTTKSAVHAPFQYKMYCGFWWGQKTSSRKLQKRIIPLIRSELNSLWISLWFSIYKTCKPCPNCPLFPFKSDPTWRCECTTFKVKKKCSYILSKKVYDHFICYEHLWVDIWFILAREMKLEKACQTVPHCFGWNHGTKVAVVVVMTVDNNKALLT